MDDFDYMEPFEGYPHRKEIYFDDIPIDSLLYLDAKCKRPTPADIILLWGKGFHLDEPQEKILISILVNAIMIASDVGMVDEADTLLNKALGNTGNDPETAIRLLIALTSLHYRGDEKKSKEYYIKARSLMSESGIKPDKMTENLWKNILKRMGNT